MPFIFSSSLLFLSLLLVTLSLLLLLFSWPSHFCISWLLIESLSCNGGEMCWKMNVYWMQVVCNAKIDVQYWSDRWYLFHNVAQKSHYHSGCSCYIWAFYLWKALRRPFWSHFTVGRLSFPRCRHEDVMSSWRCRVITKISFRFDYLMLCQALQLPLPWGINVPFPHRISS
jgi:hypothetical protein